MNLALLRVINRCVLRNNVIIITTISLLLVLVSGCNAIPNNMVVVKPPSALKISLERCRDSINIISPTAISQGSPRIPKGVVLLDGFNDFELRGPLTDELRAWKKKFVKKIDFYICLKNISKTPIKLYENWNSWGYFNVKLIFYDGSGFAIPVFRKKRSWYRNFASKQTLKPEEIIKIPISMSDPAWTNIDLLPVLKKGLGGLRVRAIFEQFQAARDCDAWTGIVTTKVLNYNKFLKNQPVK